MTDAPQQPRALATSTVRDLLDATHARLTDVGWKQGGISTPRADRPACLYYSLRLAAGLSGEQLDSYEVLAARRLLLAQLPAEFQAQGLTAWNDVRSRKVQDVLTLLETARAKC